MPPKNAVKKYKPRSIYHVYNRGAGKQNIFKDEEDYKTLLGYFKFYLTPIDLQGSSLKVAPSRVLKNHALKIELIAYCLMSNHFHLILYQEEIDSINSFLRSVATKYAMYFNRKYKRTGHLFEGIYKAVLMKTEEQLLHLSKYIHRNPLEILPTGMILEGYKYSSYGNYLKQFTQTWVKSEKVMSVFNRVDHEYSSYKEFVEKNEEIIKLKEVLLDY